MKASETKLQRIIEGMNQYVVPLFQRPYSWGAKQWSVLWEDLTELCEEDQPRSHFMGSIVTAPTQSVPEGVAEYLLIDGQQRMTTIFLLLAAVRDRAMELQMDTLAPEIELTLLKKMFKQGNDTYKLLPTQADRAAFIRIMDCQEVSAGGQIVSHRAASAMAHGLALFGNASGRAGASPGYDDAQNAGRGSRTGRARGSQFLARRRRGDVRAHSSDG